MSSIEEKLDDSHMSVDRSLRLDVSTTTDDIEILNASNDDMSLSVIKCSFLEDDKKPETNGKVCQEKKCEVNEAKSFLPHNGQATSVFETPQIEEKPLMDDCRTPSRIQIDQCSTPDVKSRCQKSPSSTIKNPFLTKESYMRRLQAPIMSPSVFHNVKEDDDGEEHDTSPSKFWTIEQIALLKPAEIDVSNLHKQENHIPLNPEEEALAQQYIVDFFNTKYDIPSPQHSKSIDKATARLVAVFSPSPAASKKRPTSRMDQLAAPSSCTKRLRDDPLAGHPITPLRSIVADKQFCTGARRLFVTRTSASTQTRITIPSDVDLEEILGQYVNNEAANDISTTTDGEDLDNSGNTSLRRRLFERDIDESGDFPPFSPPASTEQYPLRSPPPMQTLGKLCESPLMCRSSKARMHDLGTPKQQMSCAAISTESPNIPFRLDLQSISEGVDDDVASSLPRKHLAFLVSSPGLSPITKKK